MDSTITFSPDGIKNKNASSILTSKFTRKSLLLAMVALLLGDFAFSAAISILAPFFPAEASKKNVSATATGFVFSVYAIVTFLVSPFMGILIDRYGTKVVLSSGIILTGSCNFLFGLSYKLESYVFTIYCCAVRILEGAGSAAYSTASMAVIAEIFPQDMGFIQGAISVATGFGLSIGPVLGAFLYDIGGYGLPFYALGGFFVLAGPINFAFLPSTPVVRKTEKKRSPMNIFSIFAITPVLLTSAVLVTQSVAWSFLSPTLEPHLREFNLTTNQLGLCFLFMSFTYALTGPFFGCISDKISPERKWVVMFIGLLCCAFSLTLLGPSSILGLQNGIRTNILALGFFGVATALVYIPMYDILLHYVISSGYTDDPSTYGLVGGVWTSMYSLGEIIGPILGAALADNFGFPFCSTTVALCCLIMAVVVLAYFSTVDSNARKPAHYKYYSLNTEDITEQFENTSKE